MRSFLGVMLSLALALTPSFVEAVEEPQHKSIDIIQTNCSEAEEAEALEESNCKPIIEEEAERFQSNDILETTGMYNSSVFFAGNNVTDEALVYGVGFIAGNNVETKGSYEYGFHAGNVVNIDGHYEKDLFVAGNNVKINGEIGRDVYAAGALVHISTNIAGSVYVGADRVIIENATISGNVKISASKIELIGDSKIDGTFSHNDSAIITGDINAAVIDTYTDIVADSSKADFANKTLNLAWSIAAIIVFSFVGKKFFKSMDQRLVNYNTVSFLKDFLLGFCAAIIAPIVMFVLFATLVGMLAAFIILGIYIVALSVSLIVGSVILGKYLLKVKHTVLAASAALIVITALSFIPLIGSIVGLIVSLAGFGMMSRMAFDKTPKSSVEEKKSKKSA